MFRKHHSTTIDDDDDETMQHTTSSTRKEENSESENNYVSETPSKQESSSRTYISSPLEATTSPLTPNSQNRILTKLPSSLKLDTQKLIRKSSLSSFSASLSKSLRSSMHPHNVSNDYSKQAQSSNQTMKSSTWSNFHSPQTIIIIEIGRKYFKCG
ncbi:hypothetical protein C9374_002469 [Naegleria lovaniensis]|uniref:Uncharacterized protein n=1 Tax=Naegleria lovaniensis TaxID=51637 RepID=A0AA88KKF3_NAELO|nr:uncharacterized protein C9374_002469 [Naegleria lovaniensis]KAG2386725.1 hypothetical protein C9374_002469 [Naegleria lovaniensis]